MTPTGPPRYGFVTRVTFSATIHRECALKGMKPTRIPPPFFFFFFALETLFRLSGTFADLEVSGNKESAFPGCPGSDDPGRDTRTRWHRAGDGVGRSTALPASGQS